jgi:hypothetical protein
MNMWHKALFLMYLGIVMESLWKNTLKLTGIIMSLLKQADFRQIQADAFTRIDKCT